MYKHEGFSDIFFSNNLNKNIKKIKNISQDYLINLMSNLLDIESLLKQGNNPINVFTDKLIDLN